MSRSVTEILKEVLTLPPAARAALADSLLQSLDTAVDEDTEAEWQREIGRRVAELDANAVTPILWADVRSHLLSKLHDGK